MKFLFANTVNHRRMMMFITSGVFGILADLLLYKWTIASLTIWEFINTAIIGLLIFEFLYRTRRFLKLKTLPLYTVLVVVMSRWLYFILNRIESSAFSMADLYFNPLQNLFSSVRFIPSLFLTFLAYFLVLIYKNESNELSRYYIGLEHMPLTNRTAAIMGMKIGLILMAICFAVFPLILLSPTYGLIFILTWGAPLGILGGIIGALIGKNWKNNWQSTQVGGILGNIFGIGIWLSTTIFFGSPFRLGIPQ